MVLWKSLLLFQNRRLFRANNFQKITFSDRKFRSSDWDILQSSIMFLITTYEQNQTLLLKQSFYSSYPHVTLSTYRKYVFGAVVDSSIGNFLEFRQGSVLFRYRDKEIGTKWTRGGDSKTPKSVWSVIHRGLRYSRNILIFCIFSSRSTAKSVDEFGSVAITNVKINFLWNIEVT